MAKIFHLAPYPNKHFHGRVHAALPLLSKHNSGRNLTSYPVDISSGANRRLRCNRPMFRKNPLLNLHIKISILRQKVKLFKIFTIKPLTRKVKPSRLFCLLKLQVFSNLCSCSTFQTTLWRILSYGKQSQDRQSPYQRQAG